MPLPTALRRLWWRLLNSSWLVLPFVGLAGPAFLLIGLLARRAWWWAPGIVYTAVVGTGAALIAAADTPGWAPSMVAATWLVSLLHAGFVNLSWLEWRAGDADWRTKG
ncbi:hypothetical protein GCM10009662_02580 [Catellatospora coxensis]|uniref:Uncharacterized protein n=1 Tax=Catellatospora coxensis TaxID=310354 RepID=A0A8J3KYU6_9ACTN|nr:hypothetical protein Cco03nite_03000 [Catellatospora coxensis]